MPLRPVPPMLATSATELPSGDAWSYEVTLDGYRTLALKDGPKVRLLSRNLKDATGHFPSVARDVEGLRTNSALIDGEVVAVDQTGRPNFQALHHQSAHTLVFYTFDVVHVDGRDLIRLPLDERRELLEDVLHGSRLLRSEPLPGTPEEISLAVQSLGLEGVVAKRRNSRYEPGTRSRSWVKVKFNRRQEFVVGGYKPNGANFESILVGYYDRRKLNFGEGSRGVRTARARRTVSENRSTNDATVSVRESAEQQDRPLG